MNYYSDKYNHVYLYGSINNKNIIKVIKQIENYNEIRNKNGSHYNPKSIVLHMNSPGGSVTSGIALINVIHKSSVPIIILIEGICASAATLLSVINDETYATPYSGMLIHQYSRHAKSNDKHDKIKFDTKEGDLIMKQLYDIYERHTNISKKKLEVILKRDLFLSPTECKKFGMVKNILKVNKQKKFETKNKNQIKINNKNINCIQNLNNIYIYNGEDVNGNANKQMQPKFKSSYERPLEIVQTIHQKMSTGYESKPIVLRVSYVEYFNKLVDILPIINTLLTSNVPIYTVIEGPVSEYCFLFTLVGKSGGRYITEYSYVTLDFVTMMDGSIKIDDMVENTKQLQNMIVSIFKKYSKLPKKIIDNLFTERHIFDSKECVKYGLCDGIVV